MAVVKKHNGEGGTTEGMFLHRYSGGGTSQFEFPGGDPHDYIGDTFAMTVSVELAAVVADRISEGPREILKFKVIDSAPPKFVAKANGEDPDQTSIDELDDAPAGGNYGDYEPPSDDPDAAPGEDAPGEFGPPFSA
ncbi:hypothetical protein [Gordonia sp. (in: high G+C Gram-positive bacteria)]|uniref:DUF7171 family protein n=1 Tax=Gordonia sp. (in: high G+C Gram-positive bacteria) TaxID=84139 RepID=UPI002620105E|nr:hypothetical protein [Gordonia sp. (in: high G+C Gram-positive bacteria)]